jgi:Fe-S-cluster containining protein
MIDGPLLRLIKLLARGVQRADLALGRLWLRTQGEPLYRLEGRCSSCGCCCEQPTVQLPGVLFRLRSYRWLLLRWHRVVNGFELERMDRRLHALVFRCTHFDPVGRGCDSYASRPTMCRDYPRPLLYQAVPELFEACTHRAVYRHAARFDEVLREQDLPPEKLEELRRKLGLDRE